MSVRWCLMDLICISLTFKDIDHLLMCLFPICVSYLGKVYSGFLPIFSQVICFVVVIVAVFYFWCWVLWILHIFWILTLCLMYYLQKSIQIIGKLCLFVCFFFLLLMIYLPVVRLLIRLHLFIFAFDYFAWMEWFKKKLLKSMPIPVFF